MDFTCKTRAVSSFAKDVSRGKYNMHHKLQRKEGQWSNMQRGELIESLLLAYPIDPIRCDVKDDGIGYVFDGVQRSTNICNYINDGYRLPRALKPIIFDGNKYEIAGKKFSQLDETVQDRIKSTEIQVYLFTGATDEDIREMYRRQNNGRALSNTQKRTAIESDELSEIVFSLADHPFFEKVLSKTQLKRDIQRDIVREVLMLTETNNENDFTSFTSNDINSFIIWYAGNINTGKVELIRQALDKLNESFEELNINTLSVPMVIFAGYRVLKDKKSFSKLVDVINKFVETYESNEDYKQYCQGGTTSQPNVRGRLDYWRNIIREM